MKRRWMAVAAWCIILDARRTAAGFSRIRLLAAAVRVVAVVVCVDALTIVAVSTGDLRRRGGSENLGVARGVLSFVVVERVTAFVLGLDSESCLTWRVVKGGNSSLTLFKAAASPFPHTALTFGLKS